ncbi:MAG: hypothetical protein A3H44_08390 [Gammaproteobacteria bacterium RIFCSPLOWO2_02_FULL_57_10]|nr:MAG: hypothetical protein A3H44_08390 [Gammaproteobacteria bacterium RIFCSPLOWO2_02_FULL_57_10]
MTGALAFVLLIPLLWTVNALAVMLGSEDQLAMSLAIFHTLVKLLGVLVMWPLTGLLVRKLETRFRSMEEDESRVHFLDRNVQATPTLALNALALELHRMNALARRLAVEAISTEDGNNHHLPSGHRALESLNIAVGEFASGIPRNGVAATLLHGLPDAQRVGQYLVNVSEHALEMVTEHPTAELTVQELSDARNQLRAHAVTLLDHAQVDNTDWDAAVLQTLRQEFEAEYQALKMRLLRAGTAGELAPRHMAAILERLSDLHRIIDQATKAAIYLDRFIGQSRTPPPVAAEPDSESEPR